MQCTASVTTTVGGGAGSFTVTTTADNGPGSLRQAILDANAAAGADVIEFALPANPTPPTVIDLVTDLDTISGIVEIDGPGSGLVTVVSPTTALSFSAAASGSEVSGLRLATDTALVSNGISTLGAALTVDDVIAQGFSGAGVTSVDGSLTISNSVLSFNGGVGVALLVGVVGTSLTLTDVETNSNFMGVAVQGAVATGTINIDGLTAAQNATIGVSVASSGGSDVYVLNSALSQNDVGAYFTLVGGGVDIVNTDAFDNDTSGYGFTLTDADAFFNGSDTYDNGLVSPSGGGGAGLTLDNSSFVSYGSTFTGNAAALGGGLYFGSLQDLAQVTIDDSAISGNVSLGQGGGIYVGTVGGTLTAVSSFVIESSVLSGNTAESGGGGLYVDSFGNGVGAELNMQIQDSTVDGNTTTDGDGGGVLIDEVSHDALANNIFVVERSTISNNRAPGGAGGGVSLAKPSVSGGLAYVQFTNSTLSGNSAATAGALSLEGPDIVDELGVSVTNSTFLGNSSGVEVLDDATSLFIANSIVANNGSLDLEMSAANPSFFFHSNIRRPEATIAALVAAGTGVQVGVDPQVGPLADNGGPTLTHLPQPGSPVFDAGDPSFVAGTMTDQRGEARIITRLDLGAVESPFLLPATGATISPWLIGGAVTLLLAGVVILVIARSRTHTGR